MAVNKSYPAMDIFRIIAALLVVANHTGADILFTYSIGRLAVPFFFISSGFFLFKPGTTHSEQLASLLRFTKRIGGLYLVSILLYLPLNLYMGSFTGLSLLGTLADIAWNGTMYHLWYFPATLIGVWLAWTLWRLPCWLGAASAALLYLVGLLGDRYFFLSLNLSETLVDIFGFTRNALFFAGPFIFTGLCIRTAKQRLGTPLRAALFALSIALLLAEAWASLTYFPETYMQYSLYLALPLCSWLLFTLLMQKRGRGLPLLRQVSLWAYILHPWFIAVLYAVLKKVSLPGLASASGPLFFILVGIPTFAASILFALVQWRFTTHGTPRAEAAIDLAAIRHNLGEMQALLPAGCEVMAVVKANAYGHGAVPVAKTLYRAGVRRFAVATLQEGLQLRRHGVRGEILILGYTPPGQAPKLKLYRLTQTIADAEHARALAAQGLTLMVQPNIDTGMHRLGVPYTDIEDIAAIYHMPGLRVTGIYSHLATADSLAPEDAQMAHTQTKQFDAVLAQLKELGIQPGRTHLHSSYGVLHYGCKGYNCVRLGLALYGACGPLTASSVASAPKLLPAMQVTASIASVRKAAKGDSVGYSRSYICSEDMLIATLTIGYADGFPRSLQNGYAIINGEKAPIVGRISMDQLMVDVSHIPSAKQGGTALLLGNLNGITIDPHEAALCAGSIPNELLSRVGGRIPRRYLG